MLSLVAVACIALGVGYNASTLGSDGAKVDAAQEPPSTNATAQPETPSAQETAPSETPPAQETAPSETPTAETKESRQDDETKFQWPWGIISGLVGGGGIWFLCKDLLAALYSRFRDCAVTRIIGFSMNVGQKIVSFLNPARANSQSLKIEQLSIWALEVFVAATLAKCRTVRLQYEKIHLDAEPFYFDFPSPEEDQDAETVKELVDAGLLIKKGDGFRLKKLSAKRFASLLEQDNQRIARNLPYAGKAILRALRDQNDVARCEWASLTDSACFVVENLTQGQYVGDMDDKEKVNRAIFMLRKHRLVHEWNVRRGPQTTHKTPLNLAFTQKYLFDSQSFEPFTFTGLSHSELDFNRSQAEIEKCWVEGVVAPRGLQIAELLRKRPTFENLSDAASELIAAALQSCRIIYLKEGRLYLDGTPFKSRVTADELKTPKAVLDELIYYNLLINHNGGYKIATNDADIQQALYERDNARIVKLLSGAGSKFFENLANRQRVFCRLFANESTRYEIECRDEHNMSTVYTPVSSYEELKALVDFMQDNDLVCSWSLAYDAEDGFPDEVQISPSPRSQNFVSEQCPLVAGRLSERALRVARRLQGYNLPD